MARCIKACAYVLILLLCVIISSAVATKKGNSDLTYSSLRRDGIVSGFGVKTGNPLKHLNKIRPIRSPRYIWASPTLYPWDTLCAGTAIDGTWYFSPIDALAAREVINNNQQIALCYCPLAGLVISLKGSIGVSGLLKYDTFVLFDERTGALILPFTQEVYRKDESVTLRNVQMLTYKGIIDKLPRVKILNLANHRRHRAYGDYHKDERMGIGHDKPGLKERYSPKATGYHPKEFVLIVGFGGRIQKAYPFVELRKRVPPHGGSFADTVDGKSVTISYYPEYRWASAKDKNGDLLNLGYAYIFALLQHLPDIELFGSEEAAPFTIARNVPALSPTTD